MDDQPEVSMNATVVLTRVVTRATHSDFACSYIRPSTSLDTRLAHSDNELAFLSATNDTGGLSIEYSKPWPVIRQEPSSSVDSVRAVCLQDSLEYLPAASLHHHSRHHATPRRRPSCLPDQGGTQS